MKLTMRRIHSLFKHLKCMTCAAISLILYLLIAILTSFFICLLFPFKFLTDYAYKVMTLLLEYWIFIHGVIQKIFTKIDWNVSINGDIDINSWYLLVANHQSWLDILVLFQILNRKAPTVKFFMKKELFWLLPVIGFATKCLGYPFIERGKKNKLKYANKEDIKKSNIRSITKACDILMKHPSVLVIFPEGTRHKASLSETTEHATGYKHLLNPKIVGIMGVLNLMKSKADMLLDATIIYELKNKQIKNFLWSYLSCNIKKITVKIDVIKLPDILFNDFPDEKQFRGLFYKWFNANIWKAKDQFICDSVK